MRNDQPVFETIDAYIDAQDLAHQPLLRQMRELIRMAAPEATEKISYNMPAFHLDGNLVYFALAKSHLGFYPTPSAIDYFKTRLKGYSTAKGTVQLPLDKALPEELIMDVVRFRVDENMEKARLKALASRKSI